jgi:hypothetical protein
MLMPADGFSYTKGAPKSFIRPDKADAVTREFCGECGTHMTTRRPGLPPVVLKIGTLDDPSVYRGAQMAIFTVKGQSFHFVPDGAPAFKGLPPKSMTRLQPIEPVIHLVQCPCSACSQTIVTG